MSKKRRKRRVKGAQKIGERAAVAPAVEAVAAPAAHREVKIGKAKGRPMLTWVGKRPVERVTAFPAQLVEVFDHVAAVSPPPPVGGPRQ